MAGTYPSLTEILTTGYPDEWLVYVIIAVIIFVALCALDVWAVLRHKKYATKHPIQFLCIMGILQVYPLFTLMHTCGIIIPKSTDVTVFVAESYEALTFLFFLRLVLTYLGGKKKTKASLKGHTMHLNVPPCCCLFCLPKMKFTRTYFVFCEALIVINAVYALVFGFIELMANLDSSTGFPADLVESKMSVAHHFILLILLVFSIYGLSGIYHTAEEQLGHRDILRKFLVYKIFVTLVKLQDVIITMLAHHGVFTFDFNSIFTTDLRLRMLISFLVAIEALFMFPLAVYLYDIKDYIPIVDVEPKGSELESVKQNEVVEDGNVEDADV